GAGRALPDPGAGRRTGRLDPPRLPAAGPGHDLAVPAHAGQRRRGPRARRAVRPCDRAGLVRALAHAGLRRPAAAAVAHAPPGGMRPGGHAAPGHAAGLAPAAPPRAPRSTLSTRAPRMTVRSSPVRMFGSPP